MERSRPDQILETWGSVAATAVRPVAPPRRTVVRSSVPGLSLTGAAVMVAVVAVGVLWLAGPGSGPGTGGVAPTPTTTPSETPTPAPTDAGGAMFGTCDVADLSARITMWEGAAGSRIATVELAYAGVERCWIPTTSALRLIDSRGAVLIEAAADPDISELTPAVADGLTTLVRTSNYCGPTPTAPVTIAFQAAEGGIVIASPLSPTYATVPPCNGPGQAGTIEMQPWTR